MTAIYPWSPPDDPELEEWLEAHHDPKWKYRKPPLTLRRGQRTRS